MNMFVAVSKSYLFDCVTTETALIFADDLQDAKELARNAGLPDAEIEPITPEYGYRAIAISTEEVL